MSNLSKEDIAEIMIKIMSQTTESGDELIWDESHEELSKLKQKVARLLKPVPKFEPGDVVKWKKGLKNKKSPEEEQSAIVIQVLDEPVIQDERDSGTPYFREPLDLILGVLDQDGDLMLYHYDKRRFEIVERATSDEQKLLSSSEMS